MHQCVSLWSLIKRRPVLGTIRAQRWPNYTTPNWGRQTDTLKSVCHDRLHRRLFGRSANYNVRLRIGYFKMANDQRGQPESSTGQRSRTASKRPGQAMAFAANGGGVAFGSSAVAFGNFSSSIGRPPYSLAQQIAPTLLHEVKRCGSCYSSLAEPEVRILRIVQSCRFPSHWPEREGDWHIAYLIYISILIQDVLRRPDWHSLCQCGGVLKQSLNSDV